MSQSGLPLSPLNHYMRIVDVFLFFPNKQVLMLSEREADEIIPLLWKQAGKKTVKVSLCHLSLLRSSLDGKVPGLMSNSMVLGSKWSSSKMWLWGVVSSSPSDNIVATMQLFAGETMYGTETRLEALKNILRGPGVSRRPSAPDPQLIVDARGNSPFFEYSHLEKACRDLAREEQQLLLETS